MIRASAEDLWALIGDPHHLPRWWPRVERVEGVEEGAFTEVLKTAKGKLLRADFTVTATDVGARRLAWSQQLQGSPFARLLASAETEVRLAPQGVVATDVTIELRQVMAGFHSGPTGFTWGGFFPRLGTHMVRRAAAATLEEALDGLERIAAMDTATDPAGSLETGRNPSG
jgi:uncharacterized protein YndB with AHSA1/START domain